ncbi:nicotinate phosphoribosyltransferase [Marinobacterium zhoushanense]|uniref:Nicotinate phosphoribosyltransferase n=1 Tax=Marinobacterium zhoushanense TaxID=1679163 RepID=A0ABQ1KTU4_9GAMM|nr:nicotinate phosphoribosyltransferase [Marinobacterium zhoushanense]GGC08226.1 nicotinate phosphoribosyltransferase [Marinobacterium zhoushanense]
MPTPDAHPQAENLLTENRLEESPLLTDLYQLTMLQTYLDQGMHNEAVFEFFVRKIPENRNFLIFAGLEQLLAFLERTRFSRSELAYLSQTGLFRQNLIDYLASFRFSGSVHALAEGTLCFSNEPVVRITAPLPQAQLIETRLINLLQLQILIATKAARCRIQAPDAKLVDFGLRRAHGAEAGLLAARACFLGGFDGTANVLAGQRYGIPILGTMAHAYIQAHDNEMDAFRHFADSQPNNLILLIDTYDTDRGARRAAELADALLPRGIVVKGVRIDSGELGEEALRVRRILDQAGHPEITIFASSSIDERLLRDLVRRHAPIDGYGIGTSLTTSSDAPFLNCAYKLQEYAGIPRRKRSSGKATWPGRKQLFRHLDNHGKLAYDRLCCDTETVHDGIALLEPVMHNGCCLAPAEPLADIRCRVQQQIALLPDALLSLEPGPPLPLRVSDRLQRMAQETDRRFNR